MPIKQETNDFEQIMNILEKKSNSERTINNFFNEIATKKLKKEALLEEWLRQKDPNEKKVSLPSILVKHSVINKQAELASKNPKLQNWLNEAEEEEKQQNSSFTKSS